MAMTQASDPSSPGSQMSFFPGKGEKGGKDSQSKAEQTTSRRHCGDRELGDVKTHRIITRVVLFSKRQVVSIKGNRTGPMQH